jgi:hypothetical protein
MPHPVFMQRKESSKSSKECNNKRGGGNMEMYPNTSVKQTALTVIVLTCFEMCWCVYVRVFW